MWSKTTNIDVSVQKQYDRIYQKQMVFRKQKLVLLFRLSLLFSSTWDRWPKLHSSLESRFLALTLFLSPTHLYYTKQQTSHWNSKQWASLDWYWNSWFWQSKQPSFTLSLSLFLYPKRHTVLSKVHCSTPSVNVIFSGILLRKDGDSEGEHSFDGFALFDPIPGGWLFFIVFLFFIYTIEFDDNKN